MKKILLILLCILMPACHKENQFEHYKKITPKIELDFYVKNETSKTIYVTCFYYAATSEDSRWQWNKSSIVKLEPNNKEFIDIKTIKSLKNTQDIYGDLAIFDTLEEAETSIYQLLPDHKKIQLPLLIKIKDKILSIRPEYYGFKGKRLELAINQDQKSTNELDFIVENASNENFFITCFVYQLEPNQPTWIMDKTNVIELKKGSQAIIDVDTLDISKEDKENVIGVLGIFKNKAAAEKSTFELLQPDERINIGKLMQYQNQKIVIIPRTYGAIGGFDHIFPYLEYETKEK